MMLPSAGLWEECSTSRQIPQAAGCSEASCNACPISFSDVSKAAWTGILVPSGHPAVAASRGHGSQPQCWVLFRMLGLRASHGGGEAFARNLLRSSSLQGPGSLWRLPDCPMAHWAHQGKKKEVKAVNKKCFNVLPVCAESSANAWVLSLDLGQHNQTHQLQLAKNPVLLPALSTAGAGALFGIFYT